MLLLTSLFLPHFFRGDDSRVLHTFLSASILTRIVSHSAFPTPFSRREQPLREDEGEKNGEGE